MTHMSQYLDRLQLEDAPLTAREAVYLTGFALIFLAFFLKSTLILQWTPLVGWLIKWGRVAGLGIILISVLFTRRVSLPMLGIMVGAFYFAYVIRYFSSYNMFYFLALVLCAYGVRGRKIFGTALLETTILILITVIICAMGDISNLRYRRDGLIRQSLGFIYPTDFAAHLTFLSIIFGVYKNDHYRIRDAVLVIMLSVFAFIVCNARLDSIIIALSAILFLINGLTFNTAKLHKTISNFASVALGLGYPVLLLGTFYLSVSWQNGSQFADKVNHLLSSRISLVAEALTRYTVNWFGQYVSMTGYGGVSGKTMDRTIYGYFMIDSSMAQLVIMYGVVMAIMTSAIVYVMIFRTAKQHFLALQIGLGLVILHAFVAQFLFNPGYDCILFLAFANLDYGFDTVFTQRPEYDNLAQIQPNGILYAVA